MSEEQLRMGQALTDRPSVERERLQSQINTSRSSDRMDEVTHRAK